jgi:hypothetical protein
MSVHSASVEEIEVHASNGDYKLSYMRKVRTNVHIGKDDGCD